MKVCAVCGAEYDRDADYCNVCRQESLVDVAEPTKVTKRRPLRDDLFAVTVAAVSWFIGLGYLIGEMAPRELRTLFAGWALLAIITNAVGMILKNVRVFVVFAGIGFFCCLIYVAVKFS